jgi:hypothetical protein
MTYFQTVRHHTLETADIKTADKRVFPPYEREAMWGCTQLDQHIGFSALLPYSSKQHDLLLQKGAPVLSDYK